MALLGQRKWRADPTTIDATVALHRNSPDSQRLQSILSLCQTGGEIDGELWDDFEINRRSADRYLNQYLDCLQLLDGERSAHVYDIDKFNDQTLSMSTYIGDC